jgi:hypothetical protein
MKRLAGWATALFTLLALSLIAPAPTLASDHADPLEMTDPNGNLTDLFFFPKGDQYILIVDVHAKLTSPKPYDLGPYEYRVNFDLTTPLAFTSDEDRHRYGGTITAPDKIHPDASITIHLNNDATLKDRQRPDQHRQDPHVHRCARRPLHFPALFQGQCHCYGDEHSQGCVPRRAARFHAVGHLHQRRCGVGS